MERLQQLLVENKPIDIFVIAQYVEKHIVET